MKYLKLLFPVIIALIIIAVVGTINVIKPKQVTIETANFDGCKVEVLEHGINGGESLGELNQEDTKYFVNIITAMELGQEVTNYELADGESAKQYLITLSTGEKIYFGQGYGEAEGFQNGSFVHINEKVYTVKNPAVLNALYVIKERFMFYDKSWNKWPIAKK